MLVDPSSAPGASPLDTGRDAAELAESIVDPIFDRSDAAAATSSGAAITYDIPLPRLPLTSSASPRRPQLNEILTRSPVPPWRFQLNFSPQFRAGYLRSETVGGTRLSCCPSRP